VTVWTDATAGDGPLRAIQDDRRRNQQSRTARTAQATSVSEGVFRVHSGARIVVEDAGNIEVNDAGDIIIRGGALRMTNEDDTIGLVFIGTNASGVAVWRFSHGNGDPAFGLFGSTDRSYWAGLDRLGNELVSNDSETGVGLARPYLNIPMVPSTGTSVATGGPFWPAFTNVAYQEVMHGITTLWHPRISIGVGTNAPSGTVDWQLQVDGVVAGSASGTTVATFDVPGWGSTIEPNGTSHSVQLWARNTAGVQSRVIVDRCYSLQS